jgi:hypothetical protein
VLRDVARAAKGYASLPKAHSKRAIDEVEMKRFFKYFNLMGLVDYPATCMLLVALVNFLMVLSAWPNPYATTISGVGVGYALASAEKYYREYKRDLQWQKEMMANAERMQKYIEEYKAKWENRNE